MARDLMDPPASTAPRAIRPNNIERTGENEYLRSNSQVQGSSPPSDHRGLRKTLLPPTDSASARRPPRRGPAAYASGPRRARTSSAVPVGRLCGGARRTPGVFGALDGPALDRPAPRAAEQLEAAQIEIKTTPLRDPLAKSRSRRRARPDDPVKLFSTAEAHCAVPFSCRLRFRGLRRRRCVLVEASIPATPGHMRGP